MYLRKFEMHPFNEMITCSCFALVDCSHKACAYLLPNRFFTDAFSAPKVQYFTARPEGPGAMGDQGS